MKEKHWYVIPLQGDSAPFEISAFPVVVGRSQSCDISIDNPAVSRLHLQLNARGKDIQIFDLGSQTGTHIDGKKVEVAEVSRAKGAIINLGAFSFLLKYCTLKEANVSRETSGQAPAAEEKYWYYWHGGREFGPCSEPELVQAARSGRLAPSDDVEIRSPEARKQGKAWEVEGLFPEDKTRVILSVEDAPPGAAAAAPAPQSPAPSPAPAAPVPLAPSDAAISFPSNEHGAILCPHCWCRFDPEDLLSISEHPELLGDPVLGPDHQLRFLPTRLTSQGHALDARGQICPDVACPRCHLRVPRALMSCTPLIVSLVGGPYSGKSYLLAAMSWKLRTNLPEAFAMDFVDADGITNRRLNEYEERLFMQEDESAFQTLEKTQLRDPDVYVEVTLDGMNVSLPLPSVFTLRRHPLYSQVDDDGEDLNRALVLYDNAGEQFLPDGAGILEPGTQHLIHAEGTIFLYDVTEDPRIRRVLRKSGDRTYRSAYRQDVLLTEMISRVRRHLGLRGTAGYSKPLIIGVSKADVLGDMIEFGGNPWSWDDELDSDALDLSRVVGVSFATRCLLMKYAPEIVRTAESFAQHVLYMPLSALGHSPKPAESDDAQESRPGAPGSRSADFVRPCDIDPKWVDVPMLYILATLGYVPTVKRVDDSHPEAADYKVRRAVMRVSVPGSSEELEVPLTYGGFSLQSPTSGVWFRAPTLEGVTTIDDVFKQAGMLTRHVE